MKNSYFKKVLFIILLISVSIGTNAQKFINYTSADGLVEGIIYSIVEDHNNNFWFGTWYNPDGVSGLGKFDGLNWSQFTTTDGIVSDKVWELFEDSNNNLWVGSFESGLSKFDGDSWTTYTTADGLAGNSLSSIIEDSDGNLWFGTRDGGVSKFDGLTWTNYTTTEGLISNNVGSIIQDSEGNFWFGTLDAGVSKFDGTTWTNYTTDDGLASNQVYAMMEGNNNEFWFGNYANAGLSQFNAASNTWKIFTTDDGLLENRHRAMLKDNHGNLWFGGNAGVNMFDGENLFSYTTVDGMLDHRIREITQDSQDRIWFGTWSGVSVLDMNLVPIPDQNFEQALIDLEIDTNGLTGDILRVDAENATELLLNFPLLPNGNVNPFADPRVTITEKIQDLSGIEAFVNVTLLGLGYNSLTDIDLSNNTKLDDLFLSDNLLTSIDISQNILLKRFGVMRNPGMTGLDVSNNLVLEELFIDNTAISSIDVSTNINLWKFYGRWSNLTGIDLSENSNLADVRVRGSASLSYMNVKNGNNTNVTGFDIRDTSLVCITADGTTVSDVSQLMLDYSAGLLNTDCGTVYIPDPNFEQALIDLGIDSDGIINASILREDAETVTYLNIMHPNTGVADIRVTITDKIQDIIGIEAFVNLNEIHCAGNAISNLDFSSNSLLTRISAPDNNLISIDVSNNSILDHLYLFKNNLTSIDVSNNLLLRELVVQSNLITELDISSNPNIQSLFATDNRLTSLNIANGNNLNFVIPYGAVSFGAAANPNLECIIVDPDIVNTAFLQPWEYDSGVIFSSDCTTKPEHVYIPDANFEQALIDLGIDSDGVINTYILRSDVELVTELNVNNKGITDLTGIEAFTNLSVFYCQYNELQDLNITNNIVLTVLECEGNQLTQLDVTQNPQLRVLGFGPNNLTEIDVSHNPLLEAIWTNGNNLSTINLDSNPKLGVYGLSDNPYTYVSLKNGNNANVVYFVANNTDSLDCINSDAVVSSAMSSSGKTFSENCSTSIAGRWIIAPEAGALKVGPEPNSDLWWGLNKYQDDIAARGCYLDDIYEFGADGSFKNVLGNETFLEPFQGVASEQCGVPVAPHDGSSSATYIYDQITGKLTLNGKGAFIGLPKVVNGTELSDPNAAPDSIIYNVSFSENGNAMTLIIESSSGVFFTFKLIKEAVFIPDANFEQALIDLNIDSDGEINKRILRSDAESVTELNLNVEILASPHPYGANTGNQLITNVFEPIQNLTGIEAFTSLTNLSCGYHALSEVDLSNNLNLTKLELANNLLTQIDLGLLVNLDFLNIIQNQITSVDVLNNTELTVLWVESNVLTQVDIASNTKLRNIAVGYNNITQLDVSSNTELIIITAEGTNLSTIDISKNLNLKILYVFDNLNFTEVDLSKNLLLSTLGVFNTSIRTLDISNNPSFIRLFAANTPELSHLDLRNGNNSNVVSFNVTNTPNLNCIQVDADIVNNIPAGWVKDVTTSYSADSCESFDTLYVNDTSLTDDFYTSAIGSDSNPGTADLPYATIQQAINRIVEGGTIYIDAGTYTEQITISKGVTIIGADQDLTSILIPSETNPPPGSFTESGVIQTAQNIGDVFISNLSVTGDYAVGVTPIIIQSGGSVINCRLQNGNQGIFIRVDSAIKTVVIENNIIGAEYIGVNFQGSGLTASLINNTISVANQGFSAGLFAGQDFGPLPQLTITGNSINNYVTYGFLANSYNSNITQNSIVGNGGSAIQQNSGNPVNATCNWYGVSDPASVAAKINGAINYEPWLVDGTDNDPAIGFQALPDVCNGTIIPVIVLDETTNIDCFGNNNGTISISVTGGSGPFTFAWTKDGDLGFNSANEDQTGLSPGSYNLLLTDASGSNASLNNIQITQPTELTAVLTGVSTSCVNSASAVASGGTGTYSYLWSNGATTSSITSIPAGTYSVTVTDENGCTVVANTDVVGNQAFNPSISVTDVSCFGGSDGSLTVSNANGVAPFQYSIDGLNFQSSNVFNNLPAGTYTITVKDDLGCTGFNSKTVSEPIQLSVELNDVQSTCFGFSSGSISILVSGGSPSYSYRWTGPNGYVSTKSLINNLAGGEYYLTVTDSKECFEVLEVLVPTFPQIDLSAVVTNVNCKGELSGSIDISATGGSGNGFSYLWNNGANSEDRTNIGPGNYSVTVTDLGSGCTTLGEYTITQPANNLNLSITKTNASGCNNLGTIIANGSGGTPPYQYKLNAGGYQSQNLFSGLFAGNYTVELKDANGCLSTSIVTITDNGSDEFENNNNNKKAAVIFIGTPISARIALAADVDWFKFVTPAGNGNYIVNLEHPSASFNIALYPDSKNAAALVPTSPTSNEYELTGDTTYLLEISGGLSFICYDLSILPVSLAKNASTNSKVSAINEISVKSWPNPTNLYFNIKLKSNNLSDKVVVKVFDMGSKLVHYNEFNPNQEYQFGESLQGGIYFVNISQGKFTQTLKLVKY